MQRNGATVAVDSYAFNIVRATIALDKDLATRPAGYGISGKADPVGWTHRTEQGGDVFSSAGISRTVDAQPWPGAPTRMQRYFAPSLPGVSLSLRGTGGQTLLKMTGWDIAPQTVNGEKTFRLDASFDAPQDEHH